VLVEESVLVCVKVEVDSSVGAGEGDGVRMGVDSELDDLSRSPPKRRPRAAKTATVISMMVRFSIDK
jgi:hypothetical protein